MIQRRRRVVALAIVGFLAAAAIAFAGIRRDRATNAEGPASERPALLLLTSLPLIFSEDFSLHGGSPTLKALQGRYRVVPIAVTDDAELAKGRLLLMAQPQAQTPENLVALDEWVRRGGRLLLLADPLLEWPSSRPLGDPLRPPPMFVDTGLLGHWGLTLDGPDRRGAAIRKLGGRDVLTVSPGSLRGNCRISGDGLVANCVVGSGRVTVVADADLLDVADLGSKASTNVDSLVDALAALEHS